MPVAQIYAPMRKGQETVSGVLPAPDSALSSGTSGAFSRRVNSFGGVSRCTSPSGDRISRSPGLPAGSSAAYSVCTGVRSAQTSRLNRLNSVDMDTGQISRNATTVHSMYRYRLGAL